MPETSTVPDFWQFIASMGVGGVLAAYAFYINNRNQNVYNESIKKCYDDEKGRTDLLVRTIQDNTTATTKNNVLMDALHRRLDRDEIDMRRTNGISSHNG